MRKRRIPKKVAFLKRKNPEAEKKIDTLRRYFFRKSELTRCVVVF